MSLSATATGLSPYQSSLQDALETFRSLDVFEETLQEAAQLILGALTSGKKLLFCGNGGSAADGAHISTEFTCRFKEDRRPYPSISFTVDGGFLTAVGNDYKFEDIFSRQVHAYGQPGDVLIAITTSGKSRNVLLAIEEAKRRDVRTIAFLGRDGGDTAGLADIEFIVPGRATARIQEAHKFLLHALCELVEAEIPRE